MQPAHGGVRVKAGREAGHGEEGHRTWAVDPPPGWAADLPNRAANLLNRAADLFRASWAACPPRLVWAAHPVNSSVACHFTSYCRCQMITGFCLPWAAVHWPGIAPR